MVSNISMYCIAIGVIGDAGDGNFGSVVKGVCFINKQEIPVAVKTLKNAATQPGVQVTIFVTLLACVSHVAIMCS